MITNINNTIMPNFKDDKSKFTMKNRNYYKGKHAASEANSPYNKNGGEITEEFVNQPLMNKVKGEKVNPTWSEIATEKIVNNMQKLGGKLNNRKGVRKLKKTFKEGFIPNKTMRKDLTEGFIPNTEYTPQTESRKDISTDITPQTQKGKNFYLKGKKMRKDLTEGFTVLNDLIMKFIPNKKK